MKNRLEEGFVAKHGAELQDFFYRANLKGYGGDPDPYSIVVSPDGSTKISYHEENWRYLDEFYGGEPFSGMTTIWYQGKVCFTMVYWGKVLPGANQKKVYACLKAALRASKPEHPWRGPNGLVANNLRYTNIWHGNIEKFYGQEKIGNINDDWLYECDYRGGIVNLR